MHTAHHAVGISEQHEMNEHHVPHSVGTTSSKEVNVQKILMSKVTQHLSVQGEHGSFLGGVSQTRLSIPLLPHIK